MTWHNFKQTTYKKHSFVGNEKLIIYFGLRTKSFSSISLAPREFQNALLNLNFLVEWCKCPLYAQMYEHKMYFIFEFNLWYLNSVGSQLLLDNQMANLKKKMESSIVDNWVSFWNAIITFDCLSCIPYFDQNPVNFYGPKKKRGGGGISWYQDFNFHLETLFFLCSASSCRTLSWEQANWG